MTAAALLAASFVATIVAAVGLLAVTVEARVRRTRREARIGAVQGRWRHLLLEVSAGEDEGRVAWQALADVDDRQWRLVRPAVIALLAKVRGEPARELSGLLAQHGDIARAREGLASPRASRRARAAYLLGLARDERAVPGLTKLLVDRSGEVRFVAARSLGQIGDPVVAAAVLAAAGRVPGAREGVLGLPAWAAAEALLRLGPAAQGAVTGSLAAPDPHVRAVAAQVALHASYPTALAPARICVHVETEVGTKESFMAIIGALGDARDVPVLAAYVHPFAPARLRRAAVAALGALATPEAIGVLTGLLDDADRFVAVSAADALAGSGVAGRAVLQGAMAAGGRPRRIASSALHLARLRAGSGAVA